MNKGFVTVVLTLTSLLWLGIKAHAQEAELTVKVPFEFVAGGQILPAGKYIIGRVTPDAHSGITIRSYDNVALMFPTVVDGTSAQQPKLSFEHVGDERFLTKVEAPGAVYIFEVPRPALTLAQKKGHSTVSSSGGD